MASTYRHLILSDDSSKNPEAIRLDNKTTVVKEMLKCLYSNYYTCKCYSPSQREQEREQTREAMLKQLLQTTAGGKKIGCEPRMSLLCSSDVYLMDSAEMKILSTRAWPLVLNKETHGNNRCLHET